MNSRSHIARILGMCFLIAFCGFTTASSAQTVNYVPAPTGIPEVDWQNIQNGLDAMGPGETLQLAAGTYRIHRSLVFQDWNGSVVGMGAHETVIEIGKSSDGELFPAIHDPQWDDYFELNQQDFHTPIFFVNNVNGLFRIADLTVNATESGIAEKSYVIDSNSGEILFFIEVWGNDNSSLMAGALGSQVDIIIENSSFHGSRGNAQWGQPNHGIQLRGEVFSTVGDFTVRNSSFDSISTVVVNPYAMHDSEILIESNTFTNSVAPIVLWNNSDCTASILNNVATNVLWSSVMIDNISTASLPTQPCHVTVGNLETHDGAGVYAVDSPWTTLTLVVSGNEINQKRDGFFGGIEAWGTGISLLATNNKIHGEDAWYFGPIFNYGLDGAVISNNKITGRGPAAIYIGKNPFGGGGHDSNCALIGNNVEGWNTEPWFIPAIAPIWLGPDSTNCTVVGNGKNVADDGTDNTVSGMSNIGPTVPSDNVGKAVSVAQQRKRMLQ